MLTASRGELDDAYTMNDIFTHSFYAAPSQRPGVLGVEAPILNKRYKIFAKGPLFCWKKPQIGEIVYYFV